MVAARIESIGSSPAIEQAPGTLTLTTLQPRYQPDWDNESWELPKDFLLASLGDARLRVVEPIQIVIEVENGDYIAEAPELNELGYGSNRSDALRDLQRAILELYFTLVTDEPRLGPDLAATLGVLRTKIRQIP